MGAIAALVVATYAGLKPGLATALGIVWSLVNLSLLERLVVAITGRARGTRPVLRKAVFASAGMLALLGAGGMVVATYAGLKPGLATALGIVWSLVNLSLL